MLKEDKQRHSPTSAPKHGIIAFASGMSVCCQCSKSGAGEFGSHSATFGPLTHIPSKNKRRMLGTEEEGHSMCQDARQSFPSIISPESPSPPGTGIFIAILQTRKLRLREFKQPAQGHTAGRQWGGSSRTASQRDNPAGAPREHLVPTFQGPVFK